MAPIKDETVQDLKDLVHKLETRVHQLEARLEGGSSKQQSPSGSMRMILIGPPGAGIVKTRAEVTERPAYVVFARGRERKPPISEISSAFATWYGSHGHVVRSLPAKHWS